MSKAQFRKLLDHVFGYCCGKPSYFFTRFLVVLVVVFNEFIRDYDRTMKKRIYERLATHKKGNGSTGEKKKCKM